MPAKKGSSKFYSKSTGGFYSTDIHDEETGIPADVVEISNERWQELLQEQSSGKQIVAAVNGQPIAIDRPVTAESVLLSRDQALRESDWLVARHRDEVECEPNATTLTSDQYAALQSWRRALRNISSHPDFPNVTLPACPA